MYEAQQSYRGLQNWEGYLAPQVRQAELLGEVPITAEECVQLGKVIGQNVKYLGHNQAMRTLKRFYPCALAVYLVAQGVYGYKGGDYWSEVIQATGLSSTYTWQVGQVFEEILEKLGLPLFYDMRAEKAHRYVSLILSHGGIPDYCLPDFFGNMLQPSVLHTQYADMSAAELIDEWRWQSSAQYFTDKPVLRFLAYGGRVAEDFVDRCREMAWKCLDSGTVSEAEEVGLPGRVVDAYRRWIEEQSPEQVQRDLADRWRLRKPEVLIDPWGEGVILDLPPQQVPATLIQPSIIWRVTYGEKSYEVPVRVRRSGFDLKTTAERVFLSQPASTYEVSLLADNQVWRTWRYQGVSDGRPLLAFDPERGTLLPWQHSLPARRLGLLYPGQFGLQAEGEAEILEELPCLPWGWASFRGQVWDLNRATNLVLRENGQDVLTTTLRPDESSQRPHLVGGQLIAPEEPGLRAPVYVGPPPCLRIPLTGRRDMDEELARWRLTVYTRWPAIPDLTGPSRQVAKTLADLRSQLVPGEGYVDLPLSSPSLLGELPFGNFLVRLRGPLGRDAEFTLRVVPHLVICGHETLCLPNGQGSPQPATLLVEVSHGDNLECQGEGGGCRIQTTARQRDGGDYEVEVEPGVTEVELTVTRPLSSGDVVRVPVSVPIRRLRWALVGEGTDMQRREWSGQTIKLPAEELLQATSSPCLLVNLPVGTGFQPEVTDFQPTPFLRLRLLDEDEDGTELQQQDAARPRSQRGLWRFEVSAFLDTIRNCRSPVVRFELECWNIPGHDRAVRVHVLSLTRAMVVENVHLQTQHAGESVAVRLTWQEPVRLRHRRVRLWPLWRPWLSPHEQPIPDEAGGELEFEAASVQLPQGKYLLEFLVVDPWVSPVAPQKPPVGSPGTATVEMIDHAGRLRQIEQDIQGKGAHFELFLERACIEMEIGQPGDAQADLNQCYERLEEAAIPQILTLCDLVQQSGDRGMLSRLQFKMFAAGRIQRLLDERAADGVSQDNFQRYLSFLPRSGLLSVSACEKLLAVKDEMAQLYATQQLVRRGVPLGVATVLDRVRGAALSDADALNLLKLNTSFAVNYLEKQPDDPATSRLLDALARELGDQGPIVRVGSWVRSFAGWGRIEKIEEIASGRSVERFIKGRIGFRLSVTLRPQHDAEPVTIEVLEGLQRLQFKEGQKVHRCTQTDSCCFITPDANLLRGRHNHAAHGGVGPCFAVEHESLYESGRPLEYSNREPRSSLM